MALAAVAAGMMAIAFAIVIAYFVWLTTARRRSTAATPFEDFPEVLVVVPVFEEAPLIERKLENLGALRYPAEKLRIVIVDGGSSDGTVARVRRWMEGRPAFALVETRHRNKTAQLNEALRIHGDAQWVLVTDADALLTPDMVQRLLEVVTADPLVSVVGACVRPTAAHAVESLHWRATDWLRDREYDRGSAAIVAASCYLARRELIADLPPDTLADDVHVATRAMLAGRRVGHSDAIALELRSPRTLRALLIHKYRKADAYIREIVRFLPASHRMPSPMRAIFLWRAALLTIVPLFATMGGAALVASIAPRIEFIAPVLVASLIITSARGVARAVTLAAVLGIVSALALLAYPFSRQTASFPKILEPSEYRLPD